MEKISTKAQSKFAVQKKLSEYKPTPNLRQRDIEAFRATKSLVTGGK